MAREIKYFSGSGNFLTNKKDGAPIPGAPSWGPINLNQFQSGYSTIISYGERWILGVSGNTYPGAFNSSMSYYYNITDNAYNGVWTVMPSSYPTSTIAYGNNIYVGTNGRSYNYADMGNYAIYGSGTTWSSAFLPVHSNSQFNRYHATAYGNGTFVTIVNSNPMINENGSTVAATSTTGASWIQRTMPVLAGWSSVCYGNNQFVAVAGQNTNNFVNSSYTSAIAATSPDGITWTQRTLPATLCWSGIAYGNGIYIAVAYGSTNIATSTDGITWTLRVGALPPGSSPNKIDFAGAQFRIMEIGSAMSSISTDAITWITSNTPPTPTADIASGSGYTVMSTYNVFGSEPTRGGWIANTFVPLVYRVPAGRTAKVQLNYSSADGYADNATVPITSITDNRVFYLGNNRSYGLAGSYSLLAIEEY